MTWYSAQNRIHSGIPRGGVLYARLITLRPETCRCRRCDCKRTSSQQQHLMPSPKQQHTTHPLQMKDSDWKNVRSLENASSRSNSITGVQKPSLLLGDANKQSARVAQRRIVSEEIRSLESSLALMPRTKDYDQLVQFVSHRIAATKSHCCDVVLVWTRVEHVRQMPAEAASCCDSHTRRYLSAFCGGSRSG